MLAKPSHHLLLWQREGRDSAAEKHKRLFLLINQGQLQPLARKRSWLGLQTLGCLIETSQPQGASPPQPTLPWECRAGRCVTVHSLTCVRVKLLLEGNLHLSAPAPAGMEKPCLGPAWRKELCPCAWFIWLLARRKVSEKAAELLPAWKACKSLLRATTSTMSSAPWAKFP